MKCRIDPFGGLEALTSELVRNFDRFFSAQPALSLLDGGISRTFPQVRVKDEEDSIRIMALLPGLDEKSLKLSITGSELAISGERKPAALDKEPHAWHRSERSSGAFHRVLDLGVEVEAKRAKATFKQGVLEITIPKAPSAKPREIKVTLN